MNSHEMLQAYCERNGLPADDVAEKGLRVHFDGGLSAHLEGDTRTTITYRIDVAELEGTADQDAVFKACLEANTVLIGERTGAVTLDAERGRVLLVGRLECGDRDAEGFEETLEDRLDEAERLRQLAAARQ